MKKGQVFWVPPFENFITITRVSRSGDWADIVVRSNSATWAKRQPLRNGRFPFEVQAVAP